MLRTSFVLERAFRYAEIREVLPGYPYGAFNNVTACRGDIFIETETHRMARKGETLVFQSYGQKACHLQAMLLILKPSGLT